MNQEQWRTVNPDGERRVVVTRDLPGERWLRILQDAGCRIEISTSPAALTGGEIREAIGRRCDAAIGQLTEAWGNELFTALRDAGGTAYSNYAVGYDNVDLDAATRCGIPVGNTPGVLTEATAELAVALTFAAARRIGEAERYIRAGRFTGWLPTLFIGGLLRRRTVGIIGAGRIGTAYAGMMMEGHRMNVVYFSPRRNEELEKRAADYSRYLEATGHAPVFCRRAGRLEELLETADCVSIHTVLNDSTRHLIDGEKLALMKETAVLVNTSRGPVIDEAALVEHCRTHPRFAAGLDVFENEPALAEGLAECDNVVIVPHIGSATRWSREGMAVLAACNVAAMLNGFAVWNRPDILPFLSDDPPRAAPSIVNAGPLGLPVFG